MRSSRLIAVLFASALSLGGANVRADVVKPPPVSCPDGSLPQSSHSGPFCWVRPCADDAGCQGIHEAKTPLSCRPTALCVRNKTLFNRRGATKTETPEAIGSCEGGASCDPSATCQKANRCAPPKDGASKADAGTAPTPPPPAPPPEAGSPLPAARDAGSAAGPPPANPPAPRSGCATGSAQTPTTSTPVALAMAGFLAMALVRRRRARARPPRPTARAPAA